MVARYSIFVHTSENHYYFSDANQLHEGRFRPDFNGVVLISEGGERSNWTTGTR